MALTDAGSPDRRMLGFRGTLYRLGTNCCVDVPRRVSTALGGAFRIAVRGTMGGTSFRSTLVPRGGGRHRLFVSARARRSLGLSEGDPIAVRLERDLVSAPFAPELPSASAADITHGYSPLSWIDQSRPAHRRDLEMSSVRGACS